MFGFSKNMTGVSISPSGVVVARVTAGKELFLSGHANVPLPGGVLNPSYAKGNIADLDAFKEATRGALAAAGVKGGEISLSIPDEVVKVALMDLKIETRKSDAIIDYIKWRAKKLLPYDPGAAKIDYHISGDNLLAVFVNMEVVTAYEEALAALSLRPVNIAVPSIAMFNLLASGFGAWRDFVSVSVQKESFSVIVVRGGGINFHRSMGIGYSSERLIQEIVSSITFYNTGHEGVVVRKAFLSPGIDDYDVLAAHLTDATGMEVETLRISSVIKGPEGLPLELYGPAVAAAVSRR